MASATRIIGLAKLHKKLQRMPDVAKTKIKAAMERGADEIVAMMRNLVPKPGSAPYATGALRDSIGWTWGKAPQGAMTLGKMAANNLAGELTITIYAGTRDKKLGDADAYYARFVEFGTKHMAASPYFYVSYRANKKKVRSRIRRATTAAAKEVAGSS